MRATGEATSSTGSTTRPKLFARVPSDDPSEGHSAVSQAIRQAESSFSGLWRRFSDRVYARSWHGLWTSLLLKVLHFNLERAGIVSQPVESTRD